MAKYLLAFLRGYLALNLIISLQGCCVFQPMPNSAEPQLIKLLPFLPGTGRTQQFEYNCQGVAQKIENGKQSESIYSELLKIKEDYDFRESVWLVEL